MKENVICGHLIPAGTGLRAYDRLVVGSKDDIEEVFTADTDDELADINAVETLDN